MFKILLKKIKNQDKFHHLPAASLSFNGGFKYETLPGGIISIMFGSLVWYIWYTELATMINYSSNQVNSIVTMANLKELGTINL